MLEILDDECRILGDVVFKKIWKKKKTNKKIYVIRVGKDRGAEIGENIHSGVLINCRFGLGFFLSSGLNVADNFAKERERERENRGVRVGDHTASCRISTKKGSK